VAVVYHRRRPRHGRGHDRKAAQPRLYQHAWHALTGGPAGEDEDVCTAEKLLHVRPGPEELNAMRNSQWSQCRGEWPVPDHDGTEGTALGPEAVDDVDEPIRLFLRCESAHEYECGFSTPTRVRPGVELQRVSSIGDENSFA
jgi:hypothetical protein